MIDFLKGKEILWFFLENHLLNKRAFRTLLLRHLIIGFKESVLSKRDIKDKYSSQ